MAGELTPWFALIDMNSYFATLEQQANPYLRDRPVGIVKESGRSCIIAASKEAKKLGVHTGEPLRDAKRKAPNIITVPADFDKYFHNTKQLQSIFTKISPDVDLFSLDEAFIDLTSCRNLYPNTQTFFEISQKHIKNSLGKWVTFSMGLGLNRLQAKLGSEFAAPDNYFEITESNVDAVLSEAKVEDICGIGFRLTERLRRLEIRHPYQLNFYDDVFLHDHFGPFWGPELRRIGQGKDSHLLTLRTKPLEHMKSVGRSKTLFIPTGEAEYLEQMIYNLAEDMCFKARRMELVGRNVGLFLSDTDGGHWGGHINLKSRYISHTDEVYEVLHLIFHNILQSWNDVKNEVRIIKVGVQLAELKPIEETSLSWLPEVDRQDRVFRAIDQVNEKHGLYTVKSGKLLNFKIIKPELTGYLGDKIYQMKFAS